LDKQKATDSPIRHTRRGIGREGLELVPHFHIEELCWGGGGTRVILPIDSHLFIAGCSHPSIKMSPLKMQGLHLVGLVGPRTERGVNSCRLIENTQ